MKTYFVTFRSITFAQRGESVLQKAGIRCTLQRTPRWMETQGCGYCLRIRMEDGMQAVSLLRQKQVPLGKTYLQRESGELEEVQL